MAVGYLEQEWDPQYVFTRNKGKEFYAAIMDACGAGLVFKDHRAFILFDEKGDILSPELAKGFLYNWVDGELEIDSVDDMEPEEYSDLVLGGEKQEEIFEGLDNDDNIPGIQGIADKIMDYYHDVEKHYWTD